MGMGSNDNKISSVIVKSLSRDKEVKDLEPDFEDAKDAAFEEMMQAIESKDKEQFKSSLKAIIEMCKEEESYVSETSGAE